MIFLDHEQREKAMWFIDSGCSNHMSENKSMFKDLDESQNRQIRFGNDHNIQVKERGTILVKTNQNKKLIGNILYAPELAHNLFSTGQLMMSGFLVLFDEEICTIREKNSDKVLAHVHITENSMFSLQMSEIEDFSFIVHDMSKLWHLRYGYLNLNVLKLLAENEMVVGLLKIEDVDDVCEGYVYEKHSKMPFPKGQARRATSTLILVYADLCRPMHTNLLGESKYFFLLIDNFIGMYWVYFFEI